MLSFLKQLPLRGKLMAGLIFFIRAERPAIVVDQLADGFAIGHAQQRRHADRIAPKHEVKHPGILALKTPVGPNINRRFNRPAAVECRQ